MIHATDHGCASDFEDILQHIQCTSVYLLQCKKNNLFQLEKKTRDFSTKISETFSTRGCLSCTCKSYCSRSGKCGSSSLYGVWTFAGVMALIFLVPNRCWFEAFD